MKLNKKIIFIATGMMVTSAIAFSAYKYYKYAKNLMELKEQEENEELIKHIQKVRREHEERMNAKGLDVDGKPLESVLEDEDDDIYEDDPIMTGYTSIVDGYDTLSDYYDEEIDDITDMEIKEMEKLRHMPNSPEALEQYYDMLIADFSDEDMRKFFKEKLLWLELPSGFKDAQEVSYLLEQRERFFGTHSIYSTVGSVTVGEFLLFFANRATYDLGYNNALWTTWFIMNWLGYGYPFMGDATLDLKISELFNGHGLYLWGLEKLPDVTTSKNTNFTANFFLFEELYMNDWYDMDDILAKFDVDNVFIAPARPTIYEMGMEGCIDDEE